MKTLSEYHFYADMKNINIAMNNFNPTLNVIEM